MDKINLFRLFLILSSFAIPFFSLSVFAKQISPIFIFSMYVLFMMTLLLMARTMVLRMSKVTKFLFGAMIGLFSVTLAINASIAAKQGMSRAIHIMLMPYDFLPIVSLGWLAGGVVTVGTAWVCSRAD